MSEKIEVAVANVVSGFGDKALEYLSALEALTKQYAPDVVNASLAVVQMEGAQKLISAVCALSAAGVLASLSKKLWKRTAELSRANEGTYRDSEVPVGIASICMSVVTLLLGIMGLSTLINIWVWVMLFNPKLYTAYLVLGKLFN